MTVLPEVFILPDMTTARYTQMTLEQYLSDLSSDKPVPGGGSASAYVASLAMGLTQMVARVRLKRKKKIDLTPEQEKAENEKRAIIQSVLDSLEKARRDAFQIVNLDPQVYEEVTAAYNQPEKIEDALQNSFRLQADLAFLSAMAGEWNQRLMSVIEGSIQNDLKVAAEFYAAAFWGAWHTALINVKYMKDPQKKAHAESALEELKRRFEGKK